MVTNCKQKQVQRKVDNLNGAGWELLMGMIFRNMTFRLVRSEGLENFGVLYFNLCVLREFELVFQEILKNFTLRLVYSMVF